MVGSLITLFKPTETDFTSGGLGSLTDATRCEVYEERNGEYELVLEYPIYGRHYSEITYRSIIFAKPNPVDKHQPFRVYEISKPINGVVTFHAHHIRYDLDGYPIAPFTAKNISGIFSQLNSQMSQPWNSAKPPFHFTFDWPISQASTFSLVTPCAALSLLGGSEGSILDRFHGEYEWDKWNCILHKERGADRGVTIAYGRNMTDLTQEENCENVWTGVYPYWYSEVELTGKEDEEEKNEKLKAGGLVELGKTEKIVYCEGKYDHERIYILDLTGEFEEKPTAKQLKDRTLRFIKDNNLGSPTVSLTVSFLSLSDTMNYADIAYLETVRLCDTVHVIFPKMGVSSTAKCISTTYDCLTNKYISIELGDSRGSITSTIAKQNAVIVEKPTTENVMNSIKHQTQLITGNKGGYFVIHDSNGDGKPDEALFMDTDDIATAKKVLRINKQGIGFSSSGYNGPYGTAWTLDGVFNASYITTGTMAADRILGGTLKLGGGSYKNGSIRLYDANGKEFGYIDQTGIHFGGAFDLNADGSASFAGSVYAKNIKAGRQSNGVDAGHITSGQIGDSAVTEDKLQGGSVTSSKIADGSVQNGKIAGGSVSNSKLNSDLQDAIADAIYAGKVFSGSVVADYLRGDLVSCNYFNFKSNSVTLSSITYADGNTGTARTMDVLSYVRI